MTAPEDIDTGALARRIAEAATAPPPVAKEAPSHPLASVIAEQLEPLHRALDALAARLEILETR